jgi:hypothetical protein
MRRSDRHFIIARAATATACLVAALGSAGCAASKAVRPPTPAAELRTEDLLAMSPPPGERYYVLLFGSENFTRAPRHVHTWATMVRVVGDPACGGSVEAHTISWGPLKENGEPGWASIRPYYFKVLPGYNMDLDGTIREMLKAKQHIVMWGPYEVWHGNYIRFMTQKAFMESGQVGYQCIDNIGEAARTGAGCDCIHSVSDMDPMFSRDRYPLVFYGVPATRNIVRQYLSRPVIIDAPKTHDWLIPCLGLNQYPISRETFCGDSVPYSPQAIRASLAQQSSTKTVR